MKHPRIRKNCFLLALALFWGTGTAFAEYDFSATCSSGQTLYYKIIDATNHYVELTYPGSSSSYWDGYTKPTGNITLPSVVSNGGVNYTVKKIGSHAFSECYGLTGSLVIPNTVNSIGNYAFFSCFGFHGTLTLSNSITTISDCAFRSCSNFTGSLTIPNSVTSIGVNAFDGCSGFTGSLTLPNSLTYMGGEAFNGCSGFTGSLILPNNLTEINGSVFKNCSGFTGSLTIYSSVTRIRGQAFKNCTGLTQINFNAVNCADVSYSDKPFEGCGGHLSIGTGVQRIPACMFYGCSGFTGLLTIPNSVTSIGDNAFFGCSGFTGSLTLPNVLTTIGTSAFQNCSGFDGLLSLGNSLTTISMSAFNSCGFAGSLTIPNSVTTISSYAFQGCSFSGTLTLGSSVTTIGTLAFAYCNGFTGSLTIPNSVTSIESYAFFRCTGFNGTLTIPSSVTTIGYAAFEDCMGLTGSLTIPNSVTSIGARAFFSCRNFTGTLTIGSSVTSIGYGAFAYFNGITEVYAYPVVPPTLGTDAFYNVSQLPPLYVPCASTEAYHSASGWSEFMDYQGYDCDQLTYSINDDGVSVTVTGHVDGTSATGELYIPETRIIHGVNYTVTAIGEMAFYNCVGLTGSLTIPSTVTTIGEWAFNNCTGFTGSLNLPSSLTTIGDRAFYHCSGFTGPLTIPDYVATIGNRAFNNCTGFTGLLTIGVSVAQIGESAFSGCSYLTSMKVYAERPPVVGNSFLNKPANFPIDVFCSSLDDYQSAPGWSSFTNIQCFKETLTVYDWVHTHDVIPVNIGSFKYYTKSQFVMPAADLVEMADNYIYSMTFYTTSEHIPYTPACDVVVYMKEVDYTVMQDFEPLESATMVYSGVLSIVNSGSGGELTFHFDTPYAYQGGNLLVSIANTEKDTNRYIYFYGQSIMNSAVFGYSYFADSFSAIQQSFLPKTTFEYAFPPICLDLSNVTVDNITSKSADLHWTGIQDSYNVRYRTVPEGTWVETVTRPEGFVDGFENGFGRWTRIDADGDGYNWNLLSNFGYSGASPHGGGNMAISQSWDNNVVLYPDNYLVTPQVELGKTLTFWACAGDPLYAAEHFGVAVSTGSNTNPSDFTTVQEWTMTAKADAQKDTRVNRQGAWYQYTVDLSAYAGQTGYIAIRHNSSDQYILSVDDFAYNEEGTIYDCFTLAELDPLTTYEVQVQGVCAFGFTEWSELITFTTTEVEVITQTLDLSAGWNWVSFNVEVTMDDLKEAVVAAEPGASPTIKSKGNGQASYNGTLWMGALKTIDLSQMYEIKVANACTVTLEGLPVNPADHPATIKSGANWIAYPLSTGMTVTNAFAGFAVKGDNVKSKTNGQASWNNVIWTGALKNLVPGQGYIYTSAASSDRTFTFPASKKPH